MRIGVAQIKAERGDIGKNILKHTRFIESAIAMDIDMIIFPELSLTGYEPDLAKEFAIEPNDKRIKAFQSQSDSNNLIIGLGVPTMAQEKAHISMLIFQPKLKPTVYSKQYLHPSETDYFSPAINELTVNYQGHRISFAICYELSVPEHSLAAAKNGSDIYIASVLNPVNGVDKDIQRLSKIAEQYKMTVLMSNYVGKSGGYDCGGKSSIWNSKGEMVGQLDARSEGIIAIDTKIRNISSWTLV